jgi:hypothetical protein
VVLPQALINIPFEVVFHSGDGLAFMQQLSLSWIGLSMVGGLFGEMFGGLFRGDVGPFFVALFPSIFMWLGMVNKKRRVSKYR